MTQTDQVRQILAETLRLPIERIGPNASMETLPEWDSVAHVNLMMSIEQAFGLMLEVEDFARLTSIPAIVEHVAAHAA